MVILYWEYDGNIIYHVYDDHKDLDALEIMIDIQEIQCKHIQQTQGLKKRLY